MKVCARCFQVQVSAAFYKNQTSKDGLGSYCKKCLKDYRNEHKDTLNEKTRSRNQKNREQEIARTQAYNSLHSDERSLYGRRYRNTLSGAYAIYKGNATAKDRTWELTEEEFQSIVQAPCSYCGEISKKGFHGIDRVCNSVGYTKENSVSCCSMCNYMKRNYTRDEFLNKIAQIFNHNLQ
jgi:hypothetical protein